MKTAPFTLVCAALLANVPMQRPAQARVEPQPNAPLQQQPVTTTPAPIPALAPLTPAVIEPAGSTSPLAIEPAGSPAVPAIRLPAPDQSPLDAQLRKLQATALSTPRRGSPAERNAARTAWLLGLLYLHGENLPQEPAQAQRWFERARALGEPMASAGLAWCQIDGCNGPSAPAAALPWIAQLRSVDPGRAQFLEWLVAERLAPMHLSRSPDQTAPPRPSRSPQQELLRNAARAGNPGALVELGLESISNSQLPQALAYFRQAAARSPAAASNAALLESRMRQTAGSAAPPQPRTAAEWFLEARRYHRGEGVPSNYAEAVRLYQIAASSGDYQARRMLELIFSRPAPDGTINIAWMQQLAFTDMGANGSPQGAPASLAPQSWQRDPSPLYELVPLEWRTARTAPRR